MIYRFRNFSATQARRSARGMCRCFFFFLHFFARVLLSGVELSAAAEDGGQPLRRNDPAVIRSAGHVAARALRPVSTAEPRDGDALIQSCGGGGGEFRAGFRIVFAYGGKTARIIKRITRITATQWTGRPMSLSLSGEAPPGGVTPAPRRDVIRIHESCQCLVAGSQGHRTGARARNAPATRVPVTGRPVCNWNLSPARRSAPQ